MNEDLRSKFLQIGDEVLKGNRPTANLDFSHSLQTTDAATSKNTPTKSLEEEYLVNSVQKPAISSRNTNTLKYFLILAIVTIGAIFLQKMFWNKNSESTKYEQSKIDEEIGNKNYLPEKVQAEEVINPNQLINSQSPVEIKISEIPQVEVSQNVEKEPLAAPHIENPSEIAKPPSLRASNNGEWQIQNTEKSAQVLSKEDAYILKSVVFSSPMPEPMKGFNIGAVVDKSNPNIGFGFTVFSSENPGPLAIVAYSPRILDRETRIYRFFGDTPIRFFSITEDYMAFTVLVKNINDRQEVKPIAYYFKYDLKKRKISTFNVSFGPFAGTGIGLNSINSFIKDGQRIYVETSEQGEHSYRKSYFIEATPIYNSRLCYMDYLVSGESMGGNCNEKGYSFK